MKKKILSQLMILSFAFAGLFLVGNNVFADPAVIMPPDDQSGGGGITCGQYCGLCWLETNNTTMCEWKGQMRYTCWGNCP